MADTLIYAALESIGSQLIRDSFCKIYTMDPLSH